MTALLQAEGLALPGRLSETGLTLAAGEIVCLIGPNGSGKTSLLHAVTGIGGPSGSVRIDGDDPWRAGPARRVRLLTYLPATRELRWPLLARDLVRLGGAGPEEVEASIARLDLGAVAERRVDRLSTGERSRVLIARALAPRPRLLLLDEPTANLDPLWQIRLMEMLKADLAKEGGAALVAIHDLDAAGRYADRLLVMQSGRIAADGAPAEIFAGPWIRDIFGIERREGVWQPAT
ncbi:ABC transporter ATP-binding protein [Sphingosinicella sp. CPCC 101087]|uniref:ABC transporter ATP-binding protein n=1 Tax=Sphingosinicella sp. CPCC 101087 TaxID=2497754 RepID=UPI0013EA3542|nr:ABC transporter ATP-binding protein [Sphingosinicella sp. CPCC 101087]